MLVAAFLLGVAVTIIALLCIGAIQISITASHDGVKVEKRDL